VSKELASSVAGTSARRVVLVASPGVPLFELSIAAEVFGIDRHDLVPNWYDFSIVGVDEPATRIAHGITVPAGAGLRALRDADTVIVPACADVQRCPDDALVAALRDADNRGARIAAICTGSFVLAEAGLLDGRRATTHWMHAAALTSRYPGVHVDPTVLYVFDGVWTSAGSAAGVDMCLELVRQDHGAAIANEVARRIVTPPHRAGGQAQYIRPTQTARGGPRRDVQEWARRHLADITIVGMAQYARVSQRTLNRQFHAETGMSPQHWLQHARLDTAAELLENTTLTVEAVARRVGLGTATNLRTRFTGVYGVPPGHYRRTFTTAHPAAARRGAARAGGSD
jgi:AraC family transcriptional regulator, transcriptional activator FtrA